jgi:recombination protein RecT
MATQAEVAKVASKQKVVTIHDWIKTPAVKDLIAQALPKAITPERFLGVFTMVLKSTPELANCSKESLVAAVVQTVQLGLTPGNIGHCYYIPFNNKNKGREAQFVLGYKGIVEMLNRCGKATLISTEIVRDGDHFECEMGLNPVLKHIPAWDGEQMPIKGVYCVAKNLVANEKVFVYMSKAEIDKVRAASKAGQSDYSPWAKWYEEMAKKTVVKRICKLLPLSVEDQARVATDETIKHDISADMTTAPDKAEWDGDTIEAGEELATPGHPAAEAPRDEPPEPVGEEETDPAHMPPEAPAEDRSKFISEKQLKRLFAIAKKAGWNTEAIDTYIRWEYQIESKSDIPWGETYDAICSHIEKNPAQEK